MPDNEGMYLADLHVHSTFSDGKLSIPELVDFYGKRGFGAIAITDHVCEENTMIGRAARYLERTLTRATFPIYREIIRSEGARALREYGMLLIPGIELTKNSISNHRSAHVVLLGVQNYIGADGDILETVRAARAEGALAIAAHPVPTRKMEKQTLYFWDRREELKTEFDAWEVASGKILFDEVLNSGLPMVASSDLHRPEQIESWKTEFECPREQEAIFQAVRKQQLGFRYYREAS